MSGIQPLPNGRLLFTRSSLTSPNDVFVIRGLSESDVDVSKTKIEQLTKFTEDALKSKTLNPGEEFWFDGAEKKIQGWIVTPPGFKKGEKKAYPIVLLIHGGPQGAWEDQWSTRWNPQGMLSLHASDSQSLTELSCSIRSTRLLHRCDQPHWVDYIWTRYRDSSEVGIVLIKLSLELTDAIRKDWGGKPFVDMRKGWQYVLDNYPEVDPDRAVAAGASWGGYAIKSVLVCGILLISLLTSFHRVSWIQGHPEFGFGFKALFCHDGVCGLDVSC